jgi:hypothetical protein
LLEGLQGSSGRYAHQAPQPEISDPQVLIIAQAASQTYRWTTAAVCVVFSAVSFFVPALIIP